MRALVIIAIALVLTALLLWLRSLLFTRRAADQHRVYIMSARHDDNGGNKSNSEDEWPSIIGAEDQAPAQARILSENERRGLAVDRLLHSNERTPILVGREFGNGTFSLRVRTEKGDRCET